MEVRVCYKGAGRRLFAPTTWMDGCTHGRLTRITITASAPTRGARLPARRMRSPARKRRAAPEARGSRRFGGAFSRPSMRRTSHWGPTTSRPRCRPRTAAAPLRDLMGRHRPAPNRAGAKRHDLGAARREPRLPQHRGRGRSLLVMIMPETDRRVDPILYAPSLGKEIEDEYGRQPVEGLGRSGSSPRSRWAGPRLSASPPNSDLAHSGLDPRPACSFARKRPL